MCHTALSLDKDLREVKNFIWTAHTKWSHLGLELGLPFSTLEAIRIKFGNDPAECFSRMLADWLAGQGSKCTWKNLALALKSAPVNLPALADQVEETYLKTISHQSGSYSELHELGQTLSHGDKEIL